MSDEERIALALAALAEVTDPAGVGALVDAVSPEPGVIDLRFAAQLPGYAGWSWTVSTSALEGIEPTVLELQLLPGDGALVAPPWVPWEQRLAEWRSSHPAEAGDEDDEDDLDDADEQDDVEDDDELVDEVLDDGDLDGVDVDAVDDEAGDEPEGDEPARPATAGGDRG